MNFNFTIGSALSESKLLPPGGEFLKPDFHYLT